MKAVLMKKRILAGTVVCLSALIGPASPASAFGVFSTVDGCTLAGTSQQKYSGTLAWAVANTSQWPSSRHPTWNCGGATWMAQVYWRDRNGATHFSSKNFDTIVAVSNGGIAPGSPNTYDGHLIFGVHGYKARGTNFYWEITSQTNIPFT